MNEKIKIIKSIAKADLDTTEHDYVISCLKSAVSYCKEQFENSNSEIDVLPSINNVSKVLEENDKFSVIEMFLDCL